MYGDNFIKNTHIFARMRIFLYFCKLFCVNTNDNMVIFVKKQKKIWQ